MTALEKVTSALEAAGSRRLGEQTWTCPVPSHADADAPLQVIDGIPVLLECPSCRQAKVLGAIGLRMSDLDGSGGQAGPELDVGRVVELFPGADPQQAASENPVVTVRVADVRRELVRWLWPGWIPLGKLTMFDGDPGQGKSTLTLDLAGRVTTGSPLPDGQPIGVKGAVLVASAEDGVADTIRPRLEAVGADLQHVHVLDHVVDEDGPRPLVLPDDLGHVEARALELGVVLVIIDPFMAFLSGRVDAHRDQDVRRALHRMKDMAERTGAAVLAIRHFTKAAGGRAVHRGGGSVGISGAARSVLMVAPDPDDEDLRVFAVSKTNLAALPESLAYRVVADELFDCARITWEGTSARTADELAGRQGQQERPAPKLEAAEALLERMLGPQACARSDIEAAAEEEDVSWRTVMTAKKNLGVQDGQRPEPGKRGPGPSWWWLPGRAPEWAATPSGESSATSRDAGGLHTIQEGESAGQGGSAFPPGNGMQGLQPSLSTIPSAPDARAFRSFRCSACRTFVQFDMASGYSRRRLAEGHLECGAPWEPVS